MPYTGSTDFTVCILPPCLSLFCCFLSGLLLACFHLSHTLPSHVRSKDKLCPYIYYVSLPPTFLFYLNQQPFLSSCSSHTLRAVHQQEGRGEGSVQCAPVKKSDKVCVCGCVCHTTGVGLSVCQLCHHCSIDCTRNKSGQDFHSIDQATLYAL